MGSTYSSSEENYSNEDEMIDDVDFYAFVIAAIGTSTKYYTKYIDRVL